MWKDAYLTSRVLSADPLELVHMLYEHAVQLVRDARRSLAARDIASRSRDIAKTIAIVTELESSLDHERGGTVSGNLARLYEYIRFRLSEANVKQVDGPLAEVEGLLTTLSEGWSAIRTQEDPVPAAAPAGFSGREAFTSSSPFTEAGEVVSGSHTWSA